MKYLFIIDGHMAIVPSADNERQIMYIKSAMSGFNCCIFPMATLIPDHLTEVSSITEHGRVRFTTSADDYAFIREFFNGVDTVLNNLGGNK